MMVLKVSQTKREIFARHVSTCDYCAKNVIHYYEFLQRIRSCLGAYRRKEKEKGGIAHMWIKKENTLISTESPVQIVIVPYLQPPYDKYEVRIHYFGNENTLGANASLYLGMKEDCEKLLDRLAIRLNAVSIDTLSAESAKV
jgi:hypothetical protein